MLPRRLRVVSPTVEVFDGFPVPSGLGVLGPRVSPTPFSTTSGQYLRGGIHLCLSTCTGVWGLASTSLGDVTQPGRLL